MVVSEKFKYVYLDNPKTATVSTVKMLLENDPSARKRIFNIQGKEIGFRDHTTALALKNKLGNDLYQYKTFSFIRNPISKMVSAYFFYKNGKPITKGNKNPWPTRVRVLFARLFPFSLWSILYPYRSNLYHLADENGRLLVDYIGLYERLDSDLTDILNEIGVDFSISELPHENRSTHKHYERYLNNPFLKIILLKKLRRDIGFYEFIVNQPGIFKSKKYNRIKF